MTELEKLYRERLEVLTQLAGLIEDHLREHLEGVPRIDRVTSRARSVDRFLKKATAEENGNPKYKEPLNQIQDQIGARIITFYLSDVERVDEVINKYYRPIETKNLVPDSEWEFGYFGRHYVLLIPTELIEKAINKELAPDFFELQIKTLFQHAWSEANHDLGYKPELADLESDAKRRLAFTSAEAWGADRVFDELFREQNQKAN
jgi:putative GTP pyrophosphokinase